MATKNELDNQKKYSALKKEELKTLQAIAGLEKNIAKEKKDNVIFSKKISEFDASASLAAQARLKAEQGRLGYAKNLTNLASLESAMLKELQDGSINLNSLFESQTGLLDDLNVRHQEEIAAMEEKGVSGVVMADLLAQQAKEHIAISDTMTEQVDKALELNKEFDRLLVTGETVRERMADQNNTLSEQDGVIGDISKGAKKYIGIFTNGQAAFAFIVNKLYEMGKAARDFAQETGIGYANAAKLQASATVTSTKYKLMGMEAADVTSAQHEMLKLGMSIKEVSGATADSVAFMSKRYGIATGEAAKLNKILLGMADKSQATADAMMESAVALAKANDVAPGVVIDEMAQNAGEFAAAGKKGFGAMSMTAIAAKKLGMSMSAIADIADGLLDVESSIEAEMQAQVITGKRINLNRARELANANDLIGMTKELVRQLGTYEEFTQMTRIEQDMYAQSVGKTRGELAKMLQNSYKLNDLTAAQKEHYNQTGEILEKNDSWLTMENAQIAATIVAGAAALVQLISQGSALVTNLGFEKAITAEKQKQAKGGGSKGGGGKGMGKGINVKSMLKAAAGMIIIAAAMWIFAKAAQEFGDGINWANVLYGSAILVGLGIAAALIGKMSTEVIKGALAFLILGIALIPAAFAFSLLAGVDAGAIIAMAAAIIILSAAALIIGSIMMSGVGAVAFAAGAAAIALLGLAIIPFAYAMGMLKGVDVMGTMAGIVALALIGPLLAMAGIGMTLLGLGIWPFILAMMVMGPLIPTITEFAGAMIILSPPLAALAGVAGGLLLVGPALGMLGLSLFPLSLGLMALGFVSSFIPLLGVLGEHMVLLAPGLAMMASVGAGLLLIGPALGLIGLGLVPLSFGILALGFVASFIPLLGVLGEHMAVLAPPLAALAAAGGNLLLIGPGLALIGMSLVPLAIGLFALSFVSGMIPVLGQLAPILAELAPALVAMSAAGAGMFLMGAGFAAFAGGLLMMVPALYALMPLMPTLILLGGLVGAMGALGAFGGSDGEKSTGDDKKKKEPGNTELLLKLDELIAVIQQPGIIQMDGRKVGEVLHMAKGLTRT